MSFEARRSRCCASVVLVLSFGRCVLDGPSWRGFGVTSGSAIVDLWQLEGGGFNQTNGGVRDAIGAWPLSMYSLRLPNGEKDVDRIKLPPSMCYMFRREIEVESEDEDSNRF